MKLGGPAIHPGEILSDELTEIGVTASDLARAIGVPINRVRLGQWFGSGPEIWMTCRSELRTAEAALGDVLKAIPHWPERRSDPRAGPF